MYITDSKGSLINAVAGLFVLLGVSLGYAVSPYFFLFSGWVGFMLVFASITGLCPMFFVLKKAGVKNIR